jgi:hypothetical protein
VPNGERKHPQRANEPKRVPDARPPLTTIDSGEMRLSEHFRGRAFFLLARLMKRIRAPKEF